MDGAEGPGPILFDSHNLEILKWSHGAPLDSRRTTDRPLVSGSGCGGNRAARSRV